MWRGGRAALNCEDEATSAAADLAAKTVWQHLDVDHKEKNPLCDAAQVQDRHGELGDAGARCGMSGGSRRSSSPSGGARCGMPE